MPVKKESKINLLPQEEFAASILGRTLKWALSTFRTIVIVTEMIVMVAFLSRFWLDAKNSDLTDAIKQKQAVVLAQGDFEKTFRETQKQLSIFQNLSKDTKKAPVLEKISPHIPNDIILTSISLQGGSAAIKGLSTGEMSIAQFLVNLKSEKTFKEVSLKQVGQSSNNQAYLVFDINLTY